MTKAEVKHVQESLQAKGYYHGSIDGIIGPKTRNAIREYQKAENLSVNGHLDSQTVAKLGVKEDPVGEHFLVKPSLRVAGKPGTR